jgi:2-C-methyl-D-erythritol 4-phosphate cytidylyltransferase/2-C-methyl-D-erythritol 2,4-cyclodiphosphate synthase
MKNKILAIIPAAGIGERFLSKDPKQYHKIGHSTLIEKTISIFTSSELISNIIVPIHKDDKNIQNQDFYKNPKIKFVNGGDSRARSVLSALESEDLTNYDYVLTHDVARPNISIDHIRDIVNEIQNKGSDCIFFYTPISESIKKISNEEDVTLNKEDYYLVQTPQICKTKKLYTALKSCVNEGIDIPDESFVMEKMNHSLTKIKGSSSNIKVTYPEDIDLMKKFNTRVGTGFDLHTYSPGNGFLLGGYFIKCDQSINAHSDGDVLLHSIADAILGASGLGDIGIFFPDTDAANKNLDSKKIINFCLEEISKLDLEIFNIDITIICETPKISPFRDFILSSLSEILKIDQSNIGLKATTSEKIGIIGKNKAIAVQTSLNLITKK